MVPQGDAHAIVCLGTCLESANKDVRLAAVRGLSKLVSNYDEHAIIALTSLLSDNHGRLDFCDNVFVRESAVKALSQLAGNGDEAVIAALSARIDDVHEGGFVRKAAEEAKAQLSQCHGCRGGVAPAPKSKS